MPINQKNLDLINNLEKDLKDQLIWLARDAVNQTSATIDRYRNLRQFIIGLSVAVIGIVFPIMIANEIFKNNNFFVISLICFSIVVIYGICNLIILTMRELIEMPIMIDSKLEKLNSIIKELQDIKQIENNNEAGKKYLEFKKIYTEMFPDENLSFLQKIWRRYEGLLFFGFFIVGYIFLIIGFFN
jgi:hypothetical protein